MKRLLTLTLAVVFLAYTTASFAFIPPSSKWRLLGSSVDSRSRPVVVPTSTVANLPSLSASEVGALMIVTDGDDEEDCTTGLGAAKVQCYWTGSAWANLGDGQAAGSNEVTDEVYNSGNFDGDTAEGVSQDDFYDFNHLHDTDDDGLPNKVDLSTAGPVITDASGVLSSVAQLTHEDGGLEADVNAYSGLLAISGGSTSEVDALAELNAQIADATLLDDGAIADSTAIGLTTADNYSNFGDVDDDSLNEMFEAIDAAITSGDAFTVKVDAGATAGYLGAANSDGVLRTDGSVVTYTDGGNFVTIGVHAYLQDIAGITAAQGDVIYFDGSDWTNLGPGLAGQYLKSGGAAANPSWDDPAGSGDITAVGDSASGASFTADGTGNSLYFEGTTPNTYEVQLTAANPGADVAVTIPAEAGTIVLGPSGFGTDNILIKTDSTGNLTQATGIAVDDSNNMSSIGTIGSGAITSTGAVTATSFVIGSADVNETELEIIDGATLGTDDLNIIDGISDSGTLTAAELLHVDGVTSAIQTQLDARALESVIGDAIEADDLELSGTTLQLVAEIPHVDATQTISADWEWQDDTAMSFGDDNDFELSFDTDLSDDDAGDNDFGAGTFTGAGLKLNASSASDVVFLFNNAGTGGTKAYFDDIHYTGEIIFEGDGNMVLTLDTIAGGYSPTGEQIYFETDGTDKLKYSISGAEKEFANLGDSQTFTGTKTFSSNIILSELADHDSTPGAGYGYLWTKSDTPSSLIFTDDAGTDYDLTAASSGDVESVGDCASGACLDGSSDGGSYIRVYDGDSHYAEFQVPDISGNVTYTFPAATKTIPSLEGADTQVIYNDGGTAYAGDAGMTYAAATDTLTLGENGQDGILALYEEIGATDYTASLKGNASMSGDVTITLPASTGTLATLGNAETFSGTKTFSAAPVFSDGLFVGDSASDEDIEAASGNQIFSIAVEDGDNDGRMLLKAEEAGSFVTVMTIESDATTAYATFEREVRFADPSGIKLSDNNYVELDATADGMDDDEYNGVVIGGRNCGENLTQWDTVRLANDADPWHQADANAAGEFPAHGLAVAACTDTNEAIILVRGIVRNEGWTGLTPGAAIYLSETAGGITETAPSDSGDAVQIVGWALSDSEIYFDFSRPYLELE